MFELKYGNTKQLGNTKYNQVNLVLGVFVSAFLYQVHFLPSYFYIKPSLQFTNQPIQTLSKAL